MSMKEARSILSERGTCASSDQDEPCKMHKRFMAFRTHCHVLCLLAPEPSEELLYPIEKVEAALEEVIS
jgi:hypothetical protein